MNIVFDKPASVGGIYAAGKFRGQVIPNHIRATVRVAPSRTKEMFDEVAVKIQRYWDAVVNNAALGATLSFGNLSEQQEKQLKRLRGIVFVPMVAALEGGIAAPGVCVVQTKFLFFSSDVLWLMLRMLRIAGRRRYMVEG